MDYFISSLVVDDERIADGIFTNADGAWLGEVHSEQGEVKVMPLTDEGGDYIPAPDNWREFILKRL